MNALIMVITGDGKGKTTSALGQALRMAGHGRKVAFLQCIKNRPCGEHQALQHLSQWIDFKLLGAGFTWTRDLKTHEQAAQNAWEHIQKVLSDPTYALVVLDEFTYVLNKGFVSWPELQQALSHRPPTMHVLITGRQAPEPLCQMADLVSVIQAHKHPYTQGIASQAGVEF